MSPFAQAALLADEWLDRSRRHVERHLLGRGGRSAEITLEQHGHTFRLLAELRNDRGAGDAWHYEHSLRVELGVAHRTVSTLNGQWTPWPFDARQHDGLLGETASWLWSELWDDDDATPDEDWFDEERSEPSERRQTRRAIATLCDHVGELALAHSDPSAVNVARTLTRDAQFFAYSALLDDANGRVRQLIATCPALLSLTTGLSPHVDDGAMLLDGIRTGRRLNTLIADMFGVATRRSCGPEINDQSIALLRCAPSMTLRELMYLLRAPGIDINDMYACGDQRHAWFGAMATWGSLASRVRDPNAAVLLGSFVSKHAVHLGGPHHVERSVTEIIDWVSRSGAPVPSRRTSPERIRREIDRWHEDLYTSIQADPATPVAPPPTAHRAVPDLVIEPLLTVGDLIAEGRQMHHCVASLTAEAVGGYVSVFRATVTGTRATIAVVRECGGWGLMEAAGFANSPLDVSSLGIVRYWVESLK